MHEKWRGTQDLAELNAAAACIRSTSQSVLNPSYVFLTLKSEPKVTRAMQFTSSSLFRVYTVVDVCMLIFQALAFTWVTDSVS